MTPRLDPRELDRRVLPVAARGLRRLLDAVGGVPRPLALTLVAAVVLGALATAVPRGEPDVPTAAADTASGSSAPAVRLAEGRLLAVVHLEGHAAADEVPPLLDGASVRRLYLHPGAAAPGAEVVVLPVDGADPASILPALCAATSERRSRDARDLLTHAARVPATTPEQQQARVDLEERAARSAAEAEAYAGACATVFAAVVEAPAPALQELAARERVRALEPVPVGTAVEDLDVQPLLPAGGTGSPGGAP